MDKNQRPVGRNKNVGTGGGNAQRRGTGLGGKTGGPVGNAGGYSDRTPSSSSNRPMSSNSGRGGLFSGSSGLPSFLGGNTSGGRGASPGGCRNKIIMLLIIVAAIAFIYNMLQPDQGTSDPNSTGVYSNESGSGFSSNLDMATENSSTFTDSGAYPVNTSVSKLARGKRTSLKGNNSDTVTVMVYLCATDLESKSGMATADLNEMLYAGFSDQVNIIVETGGTTQWKNSVISSKTNQRYRVTKDGLEMLDKDVGKKSMVDPETLSDFIRFCKTDYPADRYMLVLWDHGGGSLSGYGYDQNFPNDGMTLDEIGVALKNGGCEFDLVGFDACLMGTLETAIVLEPYADYMIASEEVEPGIGWYYTGWMSALAENSSISTIDLGKKLIDDYVREVLSKTPGSQATLSLIDLAEFKGTVPQALGKFAQSTSLLIDGDGYQTVSDARAGAKEFASSSRINQIDLINFADKLGTEDAKSFAAILRDCIKYNRTSTNITNANGMSIFFPYNKLTQLDSMLATYDEIGMDEGYSRFIRSFASMTAGGQIVSSGSGNMLNVLLSGSSGGSQSTSGIAGADVILSLLNVFLSSGDYSSFSNADNSTGWLDPDKMKSAVSFYADNQVDASALKITEKNGQRVLTLSEKQWNLIQHMEMNVFLDDGEGYIDLGLDNVYDYNDDGDLIMEYDGTWLALNGQIVSYFMESDDHYGETYAIKGRVPAFLNGQLVDIIIVFDNQNPDGLVLGAQLKYDSEKQTKTIAKGLVEIVSGDIIDFLCDYYTYGGEYSDTYYLGEQMTADGIWRIENLSVGNGDYQMTYRITDIYDNKYWTPSVSD